MREEAPAAEAVFRSASAFPAATHGLLDTLAQNSLMADRWLSDLLPVSIRGPRSADLNFHFSALADRADHPVMLYNIPYRTGVNLGNEAMLRLAAHPNIFGSRIAAPTATSLSICCARRPDDFRRPHRRGCAISGSAERWRRRRYSCIRAYRNRYVCRNPQACGRGRARCRAGAIGARLRISRDCCSPNRTPHPIKYWLWRTGLIEQRGAKAADDRSEPGLPYFSMRGRLDPRDRSVRDEHPRSDNGPG